MTINELRQATGMTQKAFGEYFNIPCRSIQNWDEGHRKCPDYLIALIEYKLRNEGMIKAGE